MLRINSKRLFSILLATILTFLLALKFYNPLLYFLTIPLRETILSGLDVPLITTSALGEQFRISFKIALFVSLLFAILFTTKEIIISFISGVLIAYILVRFFIFKWFIIINVSEKEKWFTMEDYIGYFILFMCCIGVIFSSIIYTKKRKGI